MLVEAPYVGSVEGIPKGRRARFVVLHVARHPVVLEERDPSELEPVGSATQFAERHDFALHRGRFMVRTPRSRILHGPVFPTARLEDGHLLRLVANARDERSLPFALANAAGGGRGAFPEISDRNKAMAAIDDADFRRIVAGGRDFVETNPSREIVVSIEEQARQIVLFDGVPWRECEEPFLVIQNLYSPTLECRWGWSTVLDGSLRWPLDRLAEANAWLAETGRTNEYLKVEISRPDALGNWDAFESMAGPAKTMLDTMRGILPRADVAFMAAYVRLRDGVAAKDPHLDTTVREVFLAISAHHAVHPDDRARILRAMPLDLARSLDRWESLVLPSDVEALRF